MAVYERSGSYQANFAWKGWPRVRQTFKTKAEAEAFEAQCLADYKLGKSPPQKGGKGTTVANKVSDIKALASYCEMHCWHDVVDVQRAGNAHMFAEWVGPSVSVKEALKMAKVNEYVEYRRTTLNNSGSTINHHLSSISVLSKTAVSLELIAAKPTLPWQKPGTHRLRYFEQAEETMLLGTLVQWGLHDWHDFFVFLMDTGGRLGETRKLQWQDLRGRNVTFDSTTTKNRKTRTVPATARCAAGLERLRKSHSALKGPFAWVKLHDLYHLWNRLRARFTWMGEDTVIHTFRHTCASRLAMAGKSETMIMRWMGHSSTAVTQRYMHLSPATMDDMANALEQYNAPSLVQAA